MCHLVYREEHRSSTAYASLQPSMSSLQTCFANSPFDAWFVVPLRVRVLYQQT